MIPFRVFEKENNQLWIVLDSANNSGSFYLLAKESDDDSDGELRTIPVSDIEKFKFIEFVE